MRKLLLVACFGLVAPGIFGQDRIVPRDTGLKFNSTLHLTEAGRSIHGRALEVNGSGVRSYATPADHDNGEACDDQFASASPRLQAWGLASKV